MKKEIRTKKAPEAIGPYSQAIEFGNLLFVSGQIGIDTETGQLVEGIEAQARRVMENIRGILEEAGLCMDDVLKTTIYLADMKHFPVVNEIYASYFRKPYPARATVEVSSLPRGALIEIEVIAGR